MSVRDVLLVHSQGRGAMWGRDDASCHRPCWGSEGSAYSSYVGVPGHITVHSMEDDTGQWGPDGPDPHWPHRVLNATLCTLYA